jgi:prepilin-type N-terminal cleavage/methylation domain-containing protein
MKRQQGFTLVELMIVICLICIIISLMAPNFMRARAQAQLTSCQSNLKNIATSLEQYSADNQSRYPVAIVNITPSYLKSLPTCPSCGTFTYSYLSATAPDAYTVWCGTAGAHVMVSIPNGFPQYESGTGLRNQ